MTIIQQIEAAYGRIVRYDGRYCIWASTGIYDVRDVVTHIPGLTPDDAMDALRDAHEEDHKRAKAAARKAREADEANESEAQ